MRNVASRYPTTRRINVHEIPGVEKSVAMAKRSNSTLFVLITCILFCFACTKQTERATSVTNNRPPIANAGRDTVALSPQESITLDGSSSTDPDSNIAGYYWRNISGPSNSIANANAVRTRISLATDGVYKFELTVTDDGGLFSKDTVQVTIVSQRNACDIDSRNVIRARLVPLGKLSIGKIDMIAASANNKILFAGGSSYLQDGTGIPIRRIDIYDISNNTWSVKDLDQYPTWRLDMGIAVVNGKIFIAGGGFWGDDIYTNQVDIYSTSTNSWSMGGLSEYRTAAVGVSAGNKVFFAGGYSFNNGSNYWSNTVDIYDDATNTWSSALLSERRGYISAVAGGNKIYFAGGQKNDGQVRFSDRIDEYDIAANSWSISSLHEPLGGMATISAGNKVFFAGGQSASGESGVVEIRDMVTGEISFNCIVPRAGLGAVLKDNKVVFFTGSGADARNGTYFEIYDLKTGIWSTGLLDKSITQAAVLSVNDVIYVAGGFVNGAGSDKVWTLEF